MAEDSLADAFVEAHLDATALGPEVKVAAAKASRAAKVEIEAEIDTDPVMRTLARSRHDIVREGSIWGGLFGKGFDKGVGKDSISSIGQLQFSIAKLGVAAAGALSAITPLGTGLVGLVAGAVAVSGALALASGSLITMGTVAVSTILPAFAALKIGSLGLSDAFKSAAKANLELARTGEVSDATLAAQKAAMEGLAPSARNLVTAVGSLSGKWGDLRKAVQQQLFEGTGKAVKDLGATFLPILQRALSRVAGMVNNVALQFSKWATSAAGVKFIRGVINDMIGIFHSLLPAVRNVIVGLATLFGASMGPADQMAESIRHITRNFRDWATAVTENGGFQIFLFKAKGALDAVLNVITGVGGALKGVFGGQGAKAGVDLLNALGDRLHALSDTLNSVEGKSAMAGFFDTIAVSGRVFADVMQVIRPILAGLGDVFAQAAPAIDQLRVALLPIVTIFAEQLGSALSSAAPIIATLISSLAGLLNIIEPIAPAILPIVAAFVAYRKIAAAVTAIQVGLTAATYGAAGSTYAAGAAQRVFSAAMLVTKVRLLAVTAAQKVAAAATIAWSAVTKAAAFVGGAITSVLNAQNLAFLRQKIAMAASAIATTAFSAAQKAAAVATTIFAAAQRVLNLVLATNPIFLVIAGLIALGAAIVLAYQKSETFRAVVQAVFSALQNAAAAVLGFLRKNWPIILAILTGPIGLAVLAITRNWDRIKEGAQGVVDFIKGIPGKLVSLAGQFLSAGKTLAEKLLNGLASLAKGAGGVVGDIASGAFNAILGLINHAIDAINNAIPNSLGKGPFKIDLPDSPIPHISAAHGAVVDRETIVRAGEGRGSEMIVPMDPTVRWAPGLRQAFEQVAAARGIVGGRGGDITIPVTLPTGDPEAAALAVLNRLVLAGG